MLPSVGERGASFRRPVANRLAAALVGLLAVVAACSSPAASGASSAASAPGSGAASASPAASTPSAAASAAASTSGTIVKLSGFAFDPTTLTASAGTTVTFQNLDGVTHTVTNGKDGAPDANPLFDQSLDAGASFNFTFTKAGTFNVTCKIHHAMNMVITVH